MVTYRQIDLNGIKIAYREAGRSGARKIVLLHGFPTSSHMYRELIPALADDYHVIAPDYPGFGYSHSPDRAMSKTSKMSMSTSSMPATLHLRGMSTSTRF
jgi:pimeloyl-ACP methyl ester carboxylesterase